MTDNAIYFPYIDVPQGEWLSRVLLYWDSLLSIVPYEYVDAPQQHSREMRNLLSSGLVVPCIPGQYLGSDSRFASTFLDYVEKRSARLNLKRMSITEQPLRRVHIEKMGEIGDELVELGVAFRAQYPWYELEAWVADAFMAYLAAVLGKQPGVNAAPVTHQRSSFELLAGKRSLLNHRRYQARDVLLKGVFPQPSNPINLKGLVSFKAQHGPELRDLRRAVEEECIQLADINDDIHRQEAASLVAKRLEDEIGTVAEAMQIKWGKVFFGGICSVLGAVGGVVSVQQNEATLAIAAGSALTNAVYSTLSPFLERGDALRKPLAYAALVNSKFTAK